ncbi:DivIVA domain-containing protein [Baia soyae]|uniref:DivIVA domain-containing protein n=1 Tax=Baia soyae TaxID=1544746 RepID=A0A4R2RQM7_9BACL|nr:DivIVA domain-containing protein [Baia soyae]TCP65418.1 DivIVA domain-containing protein [Baia soyae]
MKRITPTDIINKDFKTVLRGYDAKAVDEFLDIIVRDYEEILHENEQLKRELSKGGGATSSRREQVAVPDLSEYDEIIREMLARIDRLEKRVLR